MRRKIKVLIVINFRDIKWVRMYLESIEEMSKNKKFAANYNAKYSLHSQLEMLGMIFPDYMYPLLIF